MNPRLGEIWIYPVKALDGQRVSEARITTGGSLEFDRRWAIVDESGGLVNGKRTRAIHQLRANFDFVTRIVRIERLGEEVANRVEHCAEWLSRQLLIPVRIEENTVAGFPDDTDAPGPTVIGRATLAECASWFAIGAEEMRARLRPNLVIDGLEPFGEDRLVAGEGTTVRFAIGEVVFEGINPCQRCVVPSRDPFTGVELPGFQKRFAGQREATLPAWVNRERFTHFYRASVNTSILPGGAGKFLREDDPLRLL
jgi:uncharacterized protein YcbX